MTAIQATGNYILWLAPKNAPIEDHIANLRQIGHQVEHVHDLNNSLKKDSPLPTTLILSHQQIFEASLAYLQTIKERAGEQPLFIIMHCAKPLSLIEKEQFYRLGGKELIIGDFGPEELQEKLESFNQLERKISDLLKQVQEASSMAVLSMETSSDLGSIIGFVKSAINSDSYTELAQHILDLTDHFSDACLIEIKELHQFSYHSNKPDQIDTLKTFMHEHKNQSRVQQIDDIIQINHENLVFLAKGLPNEDSAQMGRITDSLVMLCDISNRFAEALRIEEIVQKTEESKGRFLTTLSHELRTPLNSMLGFSSILLKKNSEKPLGESGIDALNRISDSTHTVNTIVNTLLDIAETQGKEASQTDIDLHRFLTRLAPPYQALANKKGLEFSCTLGDNVTLNTNEKKLATMLGNILDNAIKFTHTGTIEVSTKIKRDTEFGDRVCFIVKDTGIGIDPVNHKRIFEEIGQLNTEHDRAHYGVGLGLYYVHQITQQLDGEVDVASSLGKGSTFTLCLPIKQLEIDHSKDADNETMLF